MSLLGTAHVLLPSSSSSFYPRIVAVIPLAFVLIPLALRCDFDPHSLMKPCACRVMRLVHGLHVP
jgi:hypothetical protein